MTPKISADPNSMRAFRDWLHAAHSPAHSRRTAATNAAFLLPHLKPGMRVLDVGCGPGSITAGLADVVAPGEVVGVDANPAAIDMAIRSVSAAKRPGLRFEVADLYRLPFADASFDAVFMHAVLQHVPDAEDALRRLRRVLRPGGVIGVADADYGGSIIWPSSLALRRAARLSLRIRRYSGGDLHVGRKLAAHLSAAGFENIIASAGNVAIGTTQGALLEGQWQSAYFAAPELRQHLSAVGLATDAELGEASAEWARWGASAGAYWARFSCHATALNPG